MVNARNASNAEPPASQFQPYPGGTGALLERLVRERGAAAFSRKLSRGKLLDFFAAQPRCVVAMEACSAPPVAPLDGGE